MFTPNDVRPHASLSRWEVQRLGAAPQVQGEEPAKPSPSGVKRPAGVESSSSAASKVPAMERGAVLLCDDDAFNRLCEKIF